MTWKKRGAKAFIPTRSRVDCIKKYNQLIQSFPRHCKHDPWFPQWIQLEGGLLFHDKNKALTLYCVHSKQIKSFFINKNARFYQWEIRRKGCICYSNKCTCDCWIRMAVYENTLQKGQAHFPPSLFSLSSFNNTDNKRTVHLLPLFHGVYNWDLSFFFGYSLLNLLIEINPLTRFQWIPNEKKKWTGVWLQLNTFEYSHFIVIFTKLNPPLFFFFKKDMPHYFDGTKHMF